MSLFFCKLSFLTVTALATIFCVCCLVFDVCCVLCCCLLGFVCIVCCFVFGVIFHFYSFAHVWARVVFATCIDFIQKMRYLAPSTPRTGKVRTYKNMSPFLMCFPLLPTAEPYGQGNTRLSHVKYRPLIMPLVALVQKNRAHPQLRTFVWCSALPFSAPCASRSVFKRVSACIRCLE